MSSPAAKRPGKRPARRAAGPQPDPDLFEHRARWRVRLDAFTATPASPAELRGLLPDGALREFGADTSPAEVPDDLLVAAASAGALTSPPFLDILDGDGFTRAPCLCCYAAVSAAKAREAAAVLRVFQQYYDRASYLRSRAYARLVAALSRDLLPEEAAEVRAHLAALDATPDVVREINAVEGLCVAVPACQPAVLWIYSTPAGRQLLRSLARGLRKGGAPVRVTVASSDPAVSPRFRYRMYAATFLGPGPPGALLEAAAAWARGRKA
jgi:hypothetical protein